MKFSFRKHKKVVLFSLYLGGNCSNDCELPSDVDVVVVVVGDPYLSF